MTRTLFKLVLMVFLCTFAHAQQCSSYLFPLDVAAITSARVSGPRVAILDDNVCTVLTSSCTSKAYLLQNDVVLRAPLTRDGYTCIAFFNGKRQTTGWVESKKLTASPTPVVQGDWAGQWKRMSGDSVITIRRTSTGSYSADALATYAVTSDNVRTGAAEGTLKVTTTSEGIQIASFGDAGADRTMVCRVQLRQYGAWLLADDGATEDSNSACGGMGVTLNGIYQRQATNPKTSGK